MNKIEISLNDSPVASPGVPVYLISTMSKSGVKNIAPYGMVMPVSHSPFIYAIGSDKDRDTYRNIVETEEFVLNVPSTSMLEKVNLTGIKFPGEIDEFEKAKFTSIPALKVKTSLIAECKSHFECRLLNIYEITKTRVIIIGEVVTISIDRELFLKDFAKQKGQLDPLYYVQGAYFGLGRYVGKR
ncbi:MAG TPA: flavin reductase family protein [Candidatus Atribacteria bacterium]|jgi:flavin reductase (DIM6/NTAB) family NADH-FMN oxidoreductase RutF|nr:flavin reductase family protein [Candidatus Atribacteria bacterium]